MGNHITSIRNKMEREIKRVNDQKMAPVPKIPLEVTPVFSTALYTVAKFDYAEPESGMCEPCHPLAFPQGLSPSHLLGDSQPRNHPEPLSSMPSTVPGNHVPPTSKNLGSEKLPLLRRVKETLVEKSAPCLDPDVDYDNEPEQMNLEFRMQTQLQCGLAIDVKGSELGGKMGFKDSESGGEMGSESFALPSTPTAAHKSLFQPIPYSEQKGMDLDPSSFIMLSTSHSPHMDLPHPLMGLSVHYIPTPLGQSLPPDVCSSHVGPHPHLTMGIWTTIGILKHPKMYWPPSSSHADFGSSVQTYESSPQYQMNNNRLSEVEDEHQKRNWNRNSGAGGGGKFHRQNSSLLLPDSVCPTLRDKWPGIFPISVVNLDSKQKTLSSKYFEDWLEQEKKSKQTFSVIVVLLHVRA